MTKEQVVPATRLAVFCGLDVGTSAHCVWSLDATGRRLHDKALPNALGADAPLMPT